MRLFDFTDYGALLGLVTNSLIAGALLGVVGGLIGFFVLARDLVFPTSDFLPADSPVSYPHLWQVNETAWLHWDGNTNSVLERNIGQSMGLGAVVDPATSASTIRLTALTPAPPTPTTRRTGWPTLRAIVERASASARA